MVLRIVGNAKSGVVTTMERRMNPDVMHVLSWTGQASDSQSPKKLLR
jgi:hypothetical protein